MTFAVTSEVDDAHPSDADDAELTSAYSAAAHIGADLLVDGTCGGSVWRSRRTASTSPIRCAGPDWAELSDVDRRRARRCRAAARSPSNPAARSSCPARRWTARLPAIAAMTADRAVLRAAFAQAGLGLVLLGADPLRPAKRVNPGDRVPGDGTVLRRQPDRRRGRGDDDVDGIDSGQPRRRTAGRLGRPGAAGACARARR